MAYGNGPVDEVDPMGLQAKAPKAEAIRADEVTSLLPAKTREQFKNFIGVDTKRNARFLANVYPAVIGGQRVIAGAYFHGLRYRIPDTKEGTLVQHVKITTYYYTGAKSEKFEQQWVEAWRIKDGVAQPDAHGTRGVLVAPVDRYSMFVEIEVGCGAYKPEKFGGDYKQWPNAKITDIDWGKNGRLKYSETFEFNNRGEWKLRNDELRLSENGRGPSW